MTPERLTKNYARAVQLEERYARELRMAFKRWEKTHKAVKRYEKKLDQLAVIEAQARIANPQQVQAVEETLNDALP